MNSILRAVVGIGLSGLALVLWMLPGTVRGQDQAVPRANTLEERQRAARELGDKDFAVREAATRFLWQCGLSAQALLETVAAGDDPEASRRAARILQRFAKRDIGTLPTDRAGRFAEQALAARTNPANAMLAVLKESPTEEEQKRFLLAIPDVAKRRMAVVAMSCSCEVLLRLALKNGPGYSESLMRTAAATGDRGAVRRWLAYLLAANRVAEERAALEGKAKADLPEAGLVLLSALRYADGDHAGALELAERIGYDDVKLSVAIRRDDWIAAGEVLAAHADNHGARLAIRARAARLAGDEEKADGFHAQLLAHAAGSAEQVGSCLNLLLLEDRIDELLKILDGHGAGHSVVGCLAALGRLDEAKRYVARPGREQFAEFLPGNGPPIPDAPVTEAQLAEAFEQTIQANPPTDSVIVRAIHQERDHGFHDLALRHSARLIDALQGGDDEQRRRLPDAVQAPFYCRSTASGLFDAFREAAPDASSLDVLQQVSALLHIDGPLAPVRQFLASGESAKPPAMPSGAWRLLMAQVAWARGLDGDATAFLERAAQEISIPLHVVRQMLPAFPRERRLPLARTVVLQALADPETNDLTHAVRMLAACEFVAPAGHEKACLIPFLVVDRDGQGTSPLFSFELENLGHPGVDNSVRLDRCRRTPRSPKEGTLGELFLAERQWPEAWREERLAELLLVGQPGFIDWEWAFSPTAWQRIRAIRVLLASGRREDARKLLDLAPIHVLDADQAIALHQALQEAGMEEDAAQIFRVAYQVAGRAGEWGGLWDDDLNNLAWLCACCGRELDAARRCIDKAIAAQPGYAAYRDTLARVLAAQGRLEEAIAAQRRAVLLDPWGIRHDYRGALREYTQQKAKPER